jgi:hypothetical protein
MHGSLESNQKSLFWNKTRFIVLAQTHSHLLVMVKWAWNDEALSHEMFEYLFWLIYICLKNALIASLKLDNGFLDIYIYIIGSKEQNSLNHNMKPP